MMNDAWSGLQRNNEINSIQQQHQGKNSQCQVAIGIRGAK